MFWGHQSVRAFGCASKHWTEFHQTLVISVFEATDEIL